MNRVFHWVVVVLVTLSCIAVVPFQSVQSALTMPNRAVQTPNRSGVAQQIEFEQHFRELGVEGSILIYDLNNDRIYQHNPQRNAKPFLPASTFKILNSLISLETDVIEHELSLLNWDGIERAIPEWNRDLNMKEAIELSAVWFYQVLARRVGHEQMQKLVAQADYGNQKIGGKRTLINFG